MEITLLYFEGCPSWQMAAERINALAATMPMTVHRQLVATDEEAARLGFLGSPSLRLDGHDLFPGPSAHVGFSCRQCKTPAGFDGAPSADQIRTTIASVVAIRGTS